MIHLGIPGAIRTCDIPELSVPFHGCVPETPFQPGYGVFLDTAPRELMGQWRRHKEISHYRQPAIIVRDFSGALGCRVTVKRSLVLQDREVLEVLGTQKDNEYKTPWRSQNLLGLPTRQAS